MEYRRDVEWRSMLVAPEDLGRLGELIGQPLPGWVEADAKCPPQGPPDPPPDESMRCAGFRLTGRKCNGKIEVELRFVEVDGDTITRADHLIRQESNKYVSIDEARYNDE